MYGLIHCIISLSFYYYSSYYSYSQSYYSYSASWYYVFYFPFIIIGIHLVTPLPRHRLLHLHRIMLVVRRHLFILIESYYHVALPGRLLVLFILFVFFFVLFLSFPYY